MPMMTALYRFAAPFDEVAWRAALRREVGARRASARAVELDVAPPRSGGGVMVRINSMDGIALVYARKVSLAQGAEPERPGLPPAWVATPWRELPLWTRLRLWLGPTKLYRDDAPPPA
jgi:hypothetical protein